MDTALSRLKVARLVRGLDQRAAARESDVSFPTLGAAERMVKEPSPRLIKKLERYYGMPWSRLYQRVDLHKLL